MAEIGIGQLIRELPDIPLIDLRLARTYREGHIGRAINMPFPRTGLHASYQKRIQRVDDMGPWLAYCTNGKVSYRLASQVGANANYLKGGHQKFLEFKASVYSGTRNLVLVSMDVGTRVADVMGSIPVPFQRCNTYRHSGLTHYMIPLSAEGQPSSFQFQNNLVLDLARKVSTRPVFIPESTRRLGQVYHSLPFFQSMKHSPMIHIRQDRETRIDHLISAFGTRTEREWKEVMMSMSHMVERDILDQSLSKLRSHELPEALDTLLRATDQWMATKYERMDPVLVMEYEELTGQDKARRTLQTFIRHQRLRFNFHWDRRSA